MWWDAVTGKQQEVPQPQPRHWHTQLAQMMQKIQIIATMSSTQTAMSGVMTSNGMATVDGAFETILP